MTEEVRGCACANVHPGLSEEGAQSASFDRPADSLFARIRPAPGCKHSCSSQPPTLGDSYGQRIQTFWPEDLDHGRSLDQRLRYVSSTGRAGGGIQCLCSDGRIRRSQRNCFPNHTGRFVQGRVTPTTANAVLCEMHRTWARPEAAELAKLYMLVAPNYEAVFESYQRALEVARPNEGALARSASLPGDLFLRYRGALTGC